MSVQTADHCLCVGACLLRGTRGWTRPALHFTLPPLYSGVQEATEAVKPLLGAYYLRDDTPVPAALWHSWTHCKFVDSTGDILHFKAK
jgi:hypothetical protein